MHVHAHACVRVSLTRRCWSMSALSSRSRSLLTSPASREDGHSGGWHGHVTLTLWPHTDLTASSDIAFHRASLTRSKSHNSTASVGYRQNNFSISQWSSAYTVKVNLVSASSSEQNISAHINRTHVYLFNPPGSWHRSSDDWRHNQWSCRGRRVWAGARLEGR